ncbi:MAG TPA: DUF4229 domain-containing protein [Mycobacterium sp.]
MTTGRTPRTRVARDVLLYAVARLLLLIALSAVIYGSAWLLGVRDFPLIVVVLLALIVALPLGMWLFAPLRRRATGGLATAGERRRRDREQLRARLRDEVPGADE